MDAKAVECQGVSGQQYLVQQRAPVAEASIGFFKRPDIMVDRGFVVVFT